MMTASHGSRVLAGLVAAVLAGAGLGAQEPPPEVTRAQFDAWMTELSNWGRWGDDDQLGALNLITPAKRVEAAKLVRTGQVVSMALPIELQVLDDPDASGAIAAPAWLSGSGPSAESAAAQGRSLPVFEVDPAWPAVPAGMRLGAPSSIAIDAEDNVWVLHRPLTLPAEEDAMAAPPVVVFDAEGNFIRAWGGPGDGYEWPQREHGLHIDHEGFVWLGGNNCPTNGVPRVEPVNDDQLLKFTRDGAFVMQIGRTDGSRGNADMVNVHRPADQQVHPPTNELFVADGYGNRRVAVFDAETGRFKRRWGAFGDTPVDDDQCQVQNPTSFSDPGPSYFNVLHAIRVSNDGLVYAADREHRRVQVFTLGGAFVSQVVTPDAPFARNLALSPDAEQQFLYVGGDDGIVVVDRATLEILGTVRPEGILGAGHHIATDSRGNLYLAATGAGMQKLTFRGMSGEQ